jgi:vancomycin permeability regulator SanA
MKTLPLPISATRDGANPKALLALARGLALFFGVFALFNLVGGLLSAHFDANLWWIDLRQMSAAAATPLLLLSSLCLVGFAVRPPRSIWRRALTLGLVGSLVVAALANTVQFYSLLARRAIQPGIPIPLSLMMSLGLGLVLVAVWRGPMATRGAGSMIPVIGVAFACAVCFPLAQMYFFGKTDYRRPADVAVVLGARVYADGRLSDALADRVRTACQLYRAGLVRRLILSGGPGDGPIHETEAMQRVAVSLGVKPDDIWLDKSGLSTQATVKNTQGVFRRWHAERILVVSHAYHLPRVKLAYQRAGWDVFTVPAKESYLLRKMPYNMAREVVALWAYYVRPLARA